VRLLLDENFPLGLVRVLQQDGHDVEHIITLGWRGAPDARIRKRLEEPDLVFLTQDADFIVGKAVSAIVVVSRVRQARLLADRIDVWRKMVQSLAEADHTERLFELTDAGLLIPVALE
jgi:hypothetical protein